MLSSRYVNLRMTNEELAVLRKLAEREHRTVSSMIREAVRREAERQEKKGASRNN